MFKILHRIYVITWATVIIGSVLWIYPRSGISEPLIDWYSVWQNSQGPTSRPVGRLTGNVISVADGTTFTIRASDRQPYSIGLLGVLPIPSKTNAAVADPELLKQAKEKLSSLILSNEVEVLLTWMDSQHRGVGIVRFGTTNINALMIQNNLLELKRPYIKGLPALEQFPLIRADRLAKESTPTLPN